VGREAGYDLLIRNGRVVDGTGSPAFRADVAIVGDRIAAVGVQSGAKARQVIDAAGLVVCPGFVDPHTHSDLMLLGEPRHDAKVRQGVTTDVIGLDGISYAPAKRQDLRMLRDYLAGLNGRPDIAYDWSTIPEYLSRFDGRAAANVAFLLPHNCLRIPVMGMEARRPTAAERGRMAALAREGMEAGAIGLSTGLVYPPCCYADTEELIALCRPVARLGGFYVPHIRTYEAGIGAAIEETFRIGREAGIPVHISHFRVRRSTRDRIFEQLAAGERQGLEISFDAYPYKAGSTYFANTIPAWAHAGGPAALIGRLKDPAARRRVAREVQARGLDWAKVVISGVKTSRSAPLVGRSMAAIATEQGREPAEVLCDLVLEEDLQVSAVLHRGEDEDLEAAMAHPMMMFGSDALVWGQKPHPRAYGTYPRALGRYVREGKALRLEEAIRKMTWFPARRHNLRERGLVAAGWYADLVAFDPGRILDRATFEEPKQFPEGIPHVLVNGRPVILNGRHTGATPGRGLRFRE
jgi:N-acyl-D-amino-acid deacylase